MLVLLFVAMWFILRGDLFYVLPCVILFLCFSVLLALRLPRLGKRELILVLFVLLYNRVFNYFKHHVYYVSINSFIYYVSKNNFLEQHVYNNMMFMFLILD